MVLRSTNGAEMEIEKLIEVLRAEGKAIAKDSDSPVAYLSALLVTAADVLEEQIKLGDELHTAMHYALQSPVVDSPNTDGLCDWWELTRS